MRNGAKILAVGVAGAIIAGAVAAPASGQQRDNPWLDARVMNMAHSGGEAEAPSNTMYAFKRAVRLGADMIELDVQSTADDQLVALHNATVDQTTSGTGYVKDMTFDEVHALDAAYNFIPGRHAVPGEPPESYPLRGIRTGEQKPPTGYKRKDFAVPKLHHVLKQFPDVPINIEIKGTSDSDTASFQHTARLLAKRLNKTGRTDFIVGSFNDEALETFHRLAPDIPLSPGLNGMVNYFLTGERPIEGTVALQIPVTYSGIEVATPEFIARAHADGYAVHVWFSGSAPENEQTYNRLIDMCVDGLMPAYPALLERILDERGIVRPGQPGTDPCDGA